jgi:hypothetical protein
MIGPKEPEPAICRSELAEGKRARKVGVRK